MDNIKYYDEDGFELEFEYDISPEERDYYAQEYKNVDLVANKRNHCTSCNCHIGTPPSAEDNIHTHTVLSVTQCGKCYRFYNSGEFEKGEDGSELHCRWCGQGGELYCCSGCPYVFCKKCIIRNLASDGLKEVLSNDNWKCYGCAPKILYPLRAQHWALVNFIKKQKKALNSKMMKGLSDADVIAYHMKKDKSFCCPSKTTAPKRQRSIGLDEQDKDWSELIDDDNLNQSLNRKKKKVKTNETPKNDLQKEIKPQAYASPTVSKSSTPRNKAKLSQVRKSGPTTSVTTSSNTPVSNEPSTEIACTPELFSYFLDHSPETNGGQNYTATPTSKPKKRKTSATSKRKNAAVIDVDGYRIDLNPRAMPPLVMSNPLPRQMMRQHRMVTPTQAIQRQATYVSNAPVTNAIQKPMVPCIYPNTNVGRARTQLETEMFNAMGICQQIDEKVKKLMNSIAYKTANKMNDIKELYIHLSYLLTYTKGRVQSLQEKCMKDMRKLDFKNAASTLSSGKFSDKNRSDCDEDELEIVEPSPTIINLDDSDEERSPAKKTSNNENPVAEAKSPENDVVVRTVYNESTADLATSIENLECNVDITAMFQLDDEGDHLNDAEASLLADDAEEIPMPPPVENIHTIDINDDDYDDMKLKSNVKIVLKRAEDEFPDLMKKPLLHIMNCLIEENMRRKLSESNKKMDEYKAEDDVQCESELEKTNMEMKSSNHNIETHISSVVIVENVESP